jgi:hypothetical protein
MWLVEQVVCRYELFLNGRNDLGPVEPELRPLQLGSARIEPERA